MNLQTQSGSTDIFKSEVFWNTDHGWNRVEYVVVQCHLNSFNKKADFHQPFCC